MGVSSPRIVGRSQELEALSDAHARATAGEPGIVVVAGAAGVGKSRLITEFSVRASAAGARVFVGDCLDLVGGGLPFGPVAAILRDIARTTGPERLGQVLGPARLEFARLVPELGFPSDAPLAGRPGTTDGPDADAGQAQTRLFEHFLAVVGRLASEAPTVVVLEDVHWIDPATRDLIAFLARNLRAERALFVITSRTEHLPRTHPHAAWLAELNRGRWTRTLALEPFSADETAVQLGAILGRDVDARLALDVHRRSEGNALFNEELLSALRSGSSTLPALLSDALGAKIRGLSSKSVEVLEVAAIASRSFDERFIAAILGGVEEDYLEPVRDAVVGQVLVAGPSSYRFRHGLFAEAILADLTPGQRRSLHTRIAGALEARPELAEGGPVWVAGEAADHWRAADRPLEAFRCAVTAGRSASSLYAHGVALERWEQALAMADGMDADTRMTLLEAVGLRATDLLIRTAHVAALTGAHDRALALAEKALSPTDADPDVARSGVLRSDYARILWGAGRFERAHQVFREAAELVGATGTIADRARVMSRYSLILLWRSEVDEGVAVAREAVESARQAGLRAVEAEALDALGNGLRTLGSVGEAILRFREAHAAAAQAGAIEEQLFVSDSLAECLVDSDQLEEGVKVANLAEEDARRFGLDRTFGAMFRGNAGLALFGLGRWTDADAITDHGMEIGYGRGWGSPVRARLLAAMGRSADAQAVMTSVQEMFPEGLPDLAKLELAVPAADLHLLAGEADRALDVVLGALDIPYPFAYLRLRLDLGAAGLRAAADLALERRGRRDGEALDRATAGAERCMAEVLAQRAILAGWDMPVASKLATADLAEAELGRLQGRSEPERWAAIAAAFGSVPMPYPAAYARYRQAEAMLVLGGVKAAVGDLLREANDACHVLGARPLGAAIERLARQGRVDLTVRAVPRDAGSAPSGTVSSPRRAQPAQATRDLGLSLRELQVLRLVAAGRTNGQIALELYISPKTASVHVTHILDKLGASNRAEAAMIAERAGLLGSDVRATGT